MDKKFWKNKNVLITGFEGFLGSRLTQLLLGLGARVTGLDIKVWRKNTILSKEDYKKIKVIKGSITDLGLVSKVVRERRIDVVFHLAAEAIVGECHLNPLKAFQSNICGTWNILEACRHAPRVRAIVVASSDKAYGSHSRLPYREDFALMGRNPYDASKSCADLIAHAYFHTYGLPVVVTRCGNIFGPGEFNFSRIVPDAIRSAILGKTLNIRSDGYFTRDYIYVDDIADAYILLAERIEKSKLGGEAFNFSNEKPMKVLDVVRTVYKAIGKKPRYKILNLAKYEIRDQYLSSYKAKKMLGWKPKYTFINGIIKAVEWYKDYL